ncbi:hypothetical protein LP417_09880 [Polaromonas sp. P1-6]|nr:hypothetical protein LP417_09880 [Polaromonas sp. P1-6]
MWQQSVWNFRTRGIPNDALVADELSFIRTHSLRGEECLILMKRQGLYYAATGLASPVTGPGYAELITSKDRRLLIEQMSNLKTPCVFVGVGDETAVDLDMDPLSILKQYKVQARNAKSSMLFMRLI